MAKSGQEVVYEGWLTKSPPTKRIWRARWRRRWFSLKHSGEIPNQFILTYYADRNCRKLKGSINLDQCDQVDLGLKLDKRKLKFDHVFDIKTPTRTYYLAADSENDMKSWVNCICKVCGLKSTSDEEDLHISENNAIGVDVIYTEETKDNQTNSNETPSMSPVSTSPYIPISECITGKTPILNSQDLQILLEQNRKNSYKSDSEPQQQNNQTYGLTRTYLNYVNDINDPQFYDCPRVLVPKHDDNDLNTKKDKNNSPLQSPTDTDSVFTDDDTGDLDVSVVQKFIRREVNDNNYINTAPAAAAAPPRPPKTCVAAPSSTYINLDEDKRSELQQKGVMDEMYDFPRSHQTEADIVRNTLQRRHCYNNAVPVKVEGQVFRYDMSPKPSTSTGQVFRYDLEDLEEPASPLSQSSSTTAYSNLPSPALLADGQMLPPAVNRDLKPKRKLSDSLSSCSNPEPSSPRAAPSVDRKLKPPTPLQEAHMRKAFVEVKASPTLSITRKTLSIEEKMGGLSPTHSHIRKNSNSGEERRRAAPSPTPPGLGRSHESLLSQNDVDHFLSNKIQYLDLDLATSSQYSDNCSTNTMPARAAAASDTVYKQVDFEKTYAFNITRNNLEKERKEPFTFSKK